MKFRIEQSSSASEAYDDNETVVTLGLLIKEAKASGDATLLEIYRDRLNEIQQKANEKKEENAQRAEFAKNARKSVAKFGARAAIVGLVASGAYGIYQIGEYNRSKDVRFEETLADAAEDDGFDYISYAKRNIANSDRKLTVAPSPECTVTTVDIDYTKDGSNIRTYTFETSDGEVTVRSAEELIGRYGVELCQITE